MKQFFSCLYLVPQEKMEAWLVSVKMALEKKSQKSNVILNSESMMKIASMGADLTRMFEYLLGTGNLRSKTGRYTKTITRSQGRYSPQIRKCILLISMIVF